MQPVYAGDIRAAGNQQWKLNSTALKYIRDAHENPRGFPVVDFHGVDLTHLGSYESGQLERVPGDTTGMGCTFTPG